MTAVLATALEPQPRWTPPLSPAAYDRRVALSREERRALALIADRPRRWPAGRRRGVGAVHRADQRCARGRRVEARVVGRGTDPR